MNRYSYDIGESSKRIKKSPQIRRLSQPMVVPLQRQNRTKSNFRLLCDADVFWLREEAQSFVAAFAADAALFHAAEGDTQIAH